MAAKSTRSGAHAIFSQTLYPYIIGDAVCGVIATDPEFVRIRRIIDPMSHAFMLQDWITLRGEDVIITQEADEWKDMGGYVDVVFYVEVREFSGTPTMRLQTSPNQDDEFFNHMAALSLSASGLTQVINRFATASVPLRRWVRWRVSGQIGVPWAVTFRVWMCARPG